MISFSYRLGSMGLPAALLRSFLRATGPMFAKWSALGDVMMVSQMTAWLEVALLGRVAPDVEVEGHSAVM